MARGKIKKLVQDRGFGFIQGDAGDIFFHHSAVVDQGFDNLQVGQQVEFDMEQDRGGDKGKGPRASNVRPVG